VDNFNNSFIKALQPPLAEIIKIVNPKSLTRTKYKSKSLSKLPSNSQLENSPKPIKKSGRNWKLLRNTLSAVTKFRVPAIYTISEPVFILVTFRMMSLKIWKNIRL